HHFGSLMSRQHARNPGEMGASCILAGSSRSCNIQHGVTPITQYLRGMTPSAASSTRHERDMADAGHPLPRARLVAASADPGTAERTAPSDHPGRARDRLAQPRVLRSLDVEASTVTFGHVKVSGGEGDYSPLFVGYVQETVGIEVLPPDAPAAAEVLAPAASQTPPPRKVSRADVERCLRDIMKERPNDPPGEDELFAEMRERLGTSPGRNRLRQLRREIAPRWKRPRGHPRNF